MKNITITIDQAIKILNEALLADPEGIQLVFQRHPTTPELIKHPTIQCGKKGTISPLGLINGMIGLSEKKPGYGFICANVKKGRIVSFERTPGTEEG